MITKNNLGDLPHKPGIYVFKDKQSTILYIGKAKSIQKRVKSYFAKTYDWKVAALVDEYHSIDFILTTNETEALLLEAQLVKQHQPKFNVLLKSGQPFLYVYIDIKAKEPIIDLVRNKKKPGEYFGPFLHKKQARSAYRYLIETFKLEKCTAKIEGGCLKFHIGLCAGTCRKDFNPEAYRFRLTLLMELLKGNFEQAHQQLVDAIKQASVLLDFERARNLYEYQKNLTVIFHTLQTKFTEQKYAKENAFLTIPQEYTPEINPHLAYELQAFFKTSKPIHTIDCFDISHFQSSFMVGACIRFKDGKVDKKNIRRFTIKTLKEQNDYAALEEIITRRYRNKEDVPDLLLIDGGKGQLSVAKKVLPDCRVASLAKREETIFIDNQDHGTIINNKDDVGRVLIALRDYTHHFAITYHRLKRHKAR